MIYFYSYLLIFSALSFCASEIYPPKNNKSDTNTTDIYFGLMQSLSGNVYVGSGVIPAVQIALDLINNDSSILHGYTLHYVLADSQCNHTSALKEFFRLILNDPPILGLIGGGCSPASEPVADIIHFFNLTQISCQSSSSQLANRERYQTYFQMISSEDSLYPAVMSICRENKWRKIMIITQDENIFTIGTERLENLLRNENISFVTRVFDSTKGVLSLDNLFSTGRIFFLSMYEKNALDFICSAWKNGFTPPKYMFITIGWYKNYWWNSSNIEIVLESTLAITKWHTSSNRTQPTVPIGISQLKFEEQYFKRQKNSEYQFSRYSDGCADAVFTLAVALNKTLSGITVSQIYFTHPHLNLLKLSVKGTNFTSPKLANFKEMMLHYLSKINFFGLTSNISFDSNGIRAIVPLEIHQYRRSNNTLQLHSIGSISSKHDGYVLSYHENISSIWSDGLVPYDGIPNNTTVSIHNSITVIYSFLAFCGLVFTLFCLIFNIVFRSHKLSSPNLNYLTIIGAGILYASVVLYVIPTFNQETETTLCNIRPRLFSIGYSLCFGTILAKTWRVYCIFNKPQPKKKVIKDWHLILLVLLILLVNLILIGLLTLYDGGRAEAHSIRKRENPTFSISGIQDIREDFFTFVCSSQERDIWLGVVYGYMALLQLAALFLAFGTRKVKLHGLDDSTFIAAIVYFTSVIITITIITTVALNEFVNTFSSLLASCIFVTATIILAISFLPKMYRVYNDPKGDKVLSTMPAPSRNIAMPAAVSVGIDVNASAMSQLIELVTCSGFLG